MPIHSVRPEPSASSAPCDPQTSPRLADLGIGAQATVLGIDGEGAVRERLLDLGVVPGTAIRVVRRAPLGDPVVYELRGYHLCLRRSEATRIRVEPAQPKPPDPS